MEEAIASVLNHPEVQAAKNYVPDAIKYECNANNIFFNYGPEFTKACIQTGLKNHNRFLEAYEHVKKELPATLSKCYELKTQEETDKCVASVSIQAFKYLKQEMTKLKPDYLGV
jgi:hypothetical protein